MDLKTLLESADQYIARRQYQAAEAIYAQLAQACPNEAGIHHVHSLVLMELRRWEAASRKIEQSIRLEPENPSFHRTRGDILSHAGQPEAARSSYLQALDLMPTDADTLINLGSLMHSLGALDQALQCYRKALSVAPANIKVLNNIGKTMHDLGEPRQAVEWYDKALNFAPDYAESRFNRSVALLALGDYARGWVEYEWRFKRRAARRAYPHTLNSPRWDGSEYSGKRLLVHCEQGLGDVIQFCRYLPAVKRLGGTLLMDIHEPLLPLVKRMGVVDEIYPFRAAHPVPAGHDCHIPLMSLPKVFNTVASTIPDEMPYLVPATQKVSRWGNDIGEADGLRVGIVWRGSSIDPHRNYDLKHLDRLMADAGIRFFSLQKEITPVEENFMARYPNLVHLGDRLDDFDDTAAIIHHMDLIISVDTAVAHLAGAMGKRVWILLPHGADWRWMTHGERSPWYPSARLFRQEARNDWSSLTHRLRGELRQFAVVHHWFGLGCSALTHQQYDEAIQAFTRVLQVDPVLEPAHRNLALAYYQEGLTEKAVAAYEKALRIRPGSRDVLLNLGAAYCRLKQFGKAESCYRNAMRNDSDDAAVLYNLGNLYLEKGALDSAAAHYQQALEIQPRYPQVLCNFGRTLHRLGDFNKAMALFDQALALSPEYPEAHLNRAVTLLLTGRWEEGWRGYAWRFKCHNRQRIYPHDLHGDRWQGRPFPGRTLLVHAEQGFGDALQFVRYLPRIKKLGGTVLLEAHPAMLPLFRHIEGVDHLVEASALHPPQCVYDLHVPLCSLAGIFNAAPDTILFERPYMATHEAAAGQWRNRLPGDGINIGLVWSGSNTYPERSCRLEDFTPLTDIPGINWISLQKDEAASQIDGFAAEKGLRVFNWGRDFRHFDDTAAAIACLDLVISIDTAVAHLAGAMGKPVWLLLPKVPDWRWLMDRTDTPWYPSMRLFRQSEPADWRTAMEEIVRELRRLLHRDAHKKTTA